MQVTYAGDSLYLKEFSDDEGEKESRKVSKERNKRKQETNPVQTESKRLKEEQTAESTLYICGLPSDFRESNIKGNIFRYFDSRSTLNETLVKRLNNDLLF